MVCTLIVAPAQDRASNRSGSYNVESRAGLERLAQTSELFANAVAEFIAQHDRDRLTERVNAVYADAGHEPARPRPRRLVSPVAFARSVVKRREPAQPPLIRRGTVWWTTLPEPLSSEPGYRRPMVIVQTDAFNASQIRTVIVVALTSKLTLAAAPGNVRVSAREAGLVTDSVANISQIATIHKSFLVEYCGRLRPRTMAAIADGMRLVLEL